MTIRDQLCCGVALAAFMSAPVSAATIKLIDQGGVAGSQSEAAFNIAAAYWGSILTNDVTVNLGVSYAALDAGVIGSTGSSGMDYTVKNWETAVTATKSGSLLDQNIVLPTLSTGATNASGAIKLITSGPRTGATGVNTAANRRVYDVDTTGAKATNNKVLYLNTSVVKAIGGTASYAATNTQQLDGNMTFSSNFAFDFDPTDGITAGTFDFIGVAIHEMGHALGFVSGVDDYDFFGNTAEGRAAVLGFNMNSTSWFTALDMFRYSADATNLVAGTGNVLDSSVGAAAFFSVNGGTSALFNNKFATGAYGGDGDQASHWKDATGANACGPQIGIMDPTFCFAQMGEVTALDLAAFDAMGWNLSVDALANNGSYVASSSSIYSMFAIGGAVPEPASWTMMIAGFGLIGGAMRRRVDRVSFAV